VLYLAALKQVPAELYESARIDGAGAVQRLFKITLPMISPVIFFTIVMQLILGFQDFTAPMLVTRGGPNKATYLYGLMLYDNAFRFFKMGYASALSWILFIIIITVTVIIFKFSNVMVYYQDGGER
jgi:oligogalacturonide transport system permease protein